MAALWPNLISRSSTPFAPCCRFSLQLLARFFFHVLHPQKSQMFKKEESYSPNVARLCSQMFPWLLLRDRHGRHSSELLSNGRGNYGSSADPLRQQTHFMTTVRDSHGSGRDTTPTTHVGFGTEEGRWVEFGRRKEEKLSWKLPPHLQLGQLDEYKAEPMQGADPTTMMKLLVCPVFDVGSNRKVGIATTRW